MDVGLSSGNHVGDVCQTSSVSQRKEKTHLEWVKWLGQGYGMEDAYI